MNPVNRNTIDYIAKYEYQHILVFFKEFKKCFGFSVASLEEALKAIELDFYFYSHLVANPEIVKLYASDVPEDRPLDCTFDKLDEIKRAVAIRLRVASYVKQGRLDKAQHALEFSASIIATLAYDLCVRRALRSERIVESGEVLV